MKLLNLSVTIEFKYGLLPQISVVIAPVNNPEIIPSLVVFFHHNASNIAGPNDEPRPLQAKLTIPKIVLPEYSEYMATI